MPAKDDNSNLTIEPKVLGNVVSALKSIPDSRNSIPICSLYHMEATDSGLVVTATSLDSEASMTVDVKADISPCCLPPYLVEAAASLRGAEARFAIDERRAVVTSGRTRMEGPILPGGDFPRFTLSFDSRAEMPGAALAELMNATVDAVSAEETRYYLQGVHLEVADGRLYAVATDGHRMHTTSIAAPEGLALGESIIVPTRAVKEIARVAAKAGTGNILFEAHHSRIAVTCGQERFATKLIDGQYPDWRRVMPQRSGNNVTFDMAEMVTALDRITKMQEINEIGKKKESKTTGIKLAADGDYLTISTSGGDAAAIDSVPIEMHGDFGAHGVSARYLRATLAAMKERGAETATIDTADVGAPMRLESPTDEDFIAVVMPMRV